MALAVGDRLGPYEILAPLGAGGMGEVYRAVDTRLGRPVAIKISGAEFIGRFRREATAISALNHPNICTLYDVGPEFLVMELVDGENLAVRLRKGRLSIEQTLNYGGQIAAALAEAHSKGITHRDLKPSNVMITRNGVKVLDFGLAKSTGDETVTLTEAVMGTPAYMAPEQRAGKDCDGRTDIFALGLLLREMATGRRDGTMASLPPPLAHVVERSIAEDPGDRWQAASDVRKELEWAGQTPATPPRSALTRLHLAGWILVGILLFVVAFAWFSNRPAPSRMIRSTLGLPGSSVRLHSFALSPDGRYLAIAAQLNGKRQLWLRALDTLEIQPLAFTEDAIYPFWSPDSHWIGFFSDGKLKKIALRGGPAQSLCEAPFGRGGTWNRDDVILFSPSAASDRKLQRVSAAGGVPADVAGAPGGYKHPVFLPDGRHFLYLLAAASEEQSGIFLGSLNGTQSRRILPDISGMAFAAGRILLIRDNTLVSQAIDLATGEAKGGAIPVVAGVSKTSNVDYAPVTVSETGLLVYQTGGGLAQNQLTWVDRAGKILGAVGAAGLVNNPVLSPDEKWLAYTRPDRSSVDVWLRDLTRGAEQRFITVPLWVNGMPQWSPNGNRVAFESDRLGIENLYLKATSGGEDQLLLANRHTKLPTQWSRDGRFIVYTEIDPKTRRDIWVLPMEGDRAGTPSPFLHSEANEFLGQLSPDGHWMAYTSDESGQRQVYVRPFPTGQGQWIISLTGGEAPRWRLDGQELFFVGAGGKLMAAPVKSAAARLEPGTPMALFDANLTQPPNEPIFDYDVSADGKRFLITTTAAGSSSASLNLIENWDSGTQK